jgi:hypothetical protein
MIDARVRMYTCYIYLFVYLFIGTYVEKKTLSELVSAYRRSDADRCCGMIFNKYKIEFNDV